MGEDSKLARSFERIRSIIRKNKRRRTAKEKCENEQNLRLEELVKEVISQKKEAVKETVIDISLEQSKYVNVTIGTNFLFVYFYNEISHIINTLPFIFALYLMYDNLKLYVTYWKEKLVNEFHRMNVFRFQASFCRTY